MSAPRVSSLRINTRNDLLTYFERQMSDRGEGGRRYAIEDTRSVVIDRLRAAVLTGATNAQLAALVLGCVDALDVIDSDPRPSTP